MTTAGMLFQFSRMLDAAEVWMYNRFGEKPPRQPLATAEPTLKTSWQCSNCLNVMCPEKSEPCVSCTKTHSRPTEWVKE